MKFGALPLDQAEGAVLAHSLLVGEHRFKKGRILSGEDIARLRAAGHALVPAARLETGDIDENTSAARLAAALAGPGVRLSEARTGRCNLYATRRGIVDLQRARIDAVNRVDEALTVASVAPYALVEDGQMVATVKVIPFAARARSLAKAVRLGRTPAALLSVAALTPRRAGLILTRVPGTKEALLDGRSEVTRARLEGLGSTLAYDVRCAHDSSEVHAALEELHRSGCDPILIFGASAIADRADVIPAAIIAAGGEIIHFGMPVDPGNLLLLGRIGDGAVIGLPGCARSPKPNGFDWVLQRLLAGLEVSARDIMEMGAGGLLGDVTERPLPRHAATKPGTPRRQQRPPSVAAVILAAGLSQRMGANNKLLADLEGAPLVTRIADAALASKAAPVYVVLGHDGDKVEAALHGRCATTCQMTTPALAFLDNPDFASGLASSLHTGLAALPGDCEGVLICLGDMPLVTAAHLDALIEAFNPQKGHAICVPVRNGKQGNPVLFARRFFAEMLTLTGDVGAKSLIERHGHLVREVTLDDDAVLIDIDTPADLEGLKRDTDLKP